MSKQAAKIVEQQAELAKEIPTLSSVPRSENVWNPIPFFYYMEDNSGGVRTAVECVIPAGVIASSTLAFMEALAKTEEVQQLNKRKRQEAIDEQEAFLEQSNTNEEAKAEYRAKYPVWEVAAPEPWQVVADTRLDKSTNPKAGVKLPDGYQKSL